MKILSWDQSSNLSGYCLFDKDIIESGVIDKHKIKDSSLRIAEMSEAICEKIDEFNQRGADVESGAFGDKKCQS